MFTTAAYPGERRRCSPSSAFAQRAATGAAGAVSGAIVAAQRLLSTTVGAAVGGS
jgi:hypothetical protein